MMGTGLYTPYSNYYAGPSPLATGPAFSFSIPSRSLSSDDEYFRYLKGVLLPLPRPYLLIIGMIMETNPLKYKPSNMLTFLFSTFIFEEAKKVYFTHRVN